MQSYNSTVKAKTMDETVPRLLKPSGRSFFLFGPRGVGKSTWLRQTFRDAAYLDLLDASVFLELSREPHALEAIVGKRPAGSWVVLDEIQKIPALLDEVHRLMEARRWRFVLCGSSARKLRRGGYNLLAGHAVTRQLEPFSFQELGADFDLDFGIQWEMLPAIQLHRKDAADILNAYVGTYLKEEIREEDIVRREPPFMLGKEPHSKRSSSTNCAYTTKRTTNTGPSPFTARPPASRSIL